MVWLEITFKEHLVQAPAMEREIFQWNLTLNPSKI